MNWNQREKGIWVNNYLTRSPCLVNSADTMRDRVREMRRFEIRGGKRIGFYRRGEWLWQLDLEWKKQDGTWRLVVRSFMALLSLTQTYPFRILSYLTFYNFSSKNIVYPFVLNKSCSVRLIIIYEMTNLPLTTNVDSVFFFFLEKWIKLYKLLSYYFYNTFSFLL